MKNLKSIAKQWKTITFNQFKAIYNNLKIVNPQDVAKLSKIKFTDNEILIMATKRPENPNQAPKWFRDFVTKQFTPLAKIVKQDQKLLMKVIKLNNLKTK